MFTWFGGELADFKKIMKGGLMDENELEDLRRRYTNRGPIMGNTSYREWLIGMLLQGIVVSKPNSPNHEVAQRAIHLADMVVELYLRTEKLNEEVKENYCEFLKMGANKDQPDNWHADFENRLFQGTFKRPKIQNS